MATTKISAKELRLLQRLLFAHSVELKPSTHPKDRQQREETLALFARFSILLNRHDSKIKNEVNHG